MMSACCFLGSQKLTAWSYDREARPISISLMCSYAACLLKSSIKRCVDSFPFLEQQPEDPLAFGRHAIEALVAFVFLAPLLTKSPWLSRRRKSG